MEDREVLAYLISCSGSSGSLSSGRTKNNHKSLSRDHPSSFHCNCFRCYTSYWVRWDSSPNHQLIHEIIDAFEDDLLQKTNMKNKTEKKKRVCNKGSVDGNSPEEISGREELDNLETLEACSGETGKSEEAEDLEKGSVRRFVSFIGERLWGVWG
uniref:Uncharacterized protein n=1 Tax=Nelumbo nucifera TaxID=4432 RepID=A0A822Y9T9_NELNU|nr:TPA_asm: hypothetical protein HUJ06_029799 [Nelumbo nucifera]